MVSTHWALQTEDFGLPFAKFRKVDYDRAGRYGSMPRRFNALLDHVTIASMLYSMIFFAMELATEVSDIHWNAFTSARLGQKERA
jgi:hypothetical protein